MLFILNSLALRPVFLGKDSRQQFLSYQNIYNKDHHFINQQMPLVQIVQRHGIVSSFIFVPDFCNYEYVIQKLVVPVCN
ncbi:hypothetical protein CHI10_13665 [Bacillus sp. 7894-2]|nr:hypothetical protein CHI10_13665 [Bacillus sp. 7894-2]